MSWFANSMVDYAPSGSEFGLIVRPIGGGANGAVKVELVGGGISIGSASFTPATVVRDISDTSWVNVGVGAESASTLHMPIKIMGSGSAWVEPLASTPIGSELAIPVRQVGVVDVTGSVSITEPLMVIVSGSTSTSPVSGAIYTVTGTTGAGVVILPARTREAFSIYNHSNSILYITMGNAASTSSFTVPIVQGAYFESPTAYVGSIVGVWETPVTGSAMVTEYI